jgi:preprotein translocase subunit Sec61beta
VNQLYQSPNGGEPSFVLNATFAGAGTINTWESYAGFNIDVSPSALEKTAIIFGAIVDFSDNVADNAFYTVEFGTIDIPWVLAPVRGFSMNAASAVNGVRSTLGQINSASGVATYTKIGNFIAPILLPYEQGPFVFKFDLPIEFNLSRALLGQNKQPVIRSTLTTQNGGGSLRASDITYYFNEFG